MTKKYLFWIVIIFCNINCIIICIIIIIKWNAALVNIKLFFQKHKKSYWLQTLEQ